MLKYNIQEKVIGSLFFVLMIMMQQKCWWKECSAKIVNTNIFQSRLNIEDECSVREKQKETKMLKK